MSVLRLQLVGRCQLRCGYCCPSSAESTALGAITPALAERAVRLLARTGVRRIRLTGGEPLLHPDVVGIVERLSRVRGIEEVALTTNGQRLASLAPALRAAGLGRVNVHIDSLRPERYARLCGGRLDRALAGLDAAIAGDLAPKLNVVVQRGENDDELADFCALASQRRVCVRFIELMDTRVASSLVAGRYVPSAEIRAGLEALGAVRAGRRGNAPADDYLLRDGAHVGVIASESEPFCDTCDRLRLDATGRLRTCLYAAKGLDVGAMIAGGASDDAVLGALSAAIAAKRSLHPRLRPVHSNEPRFSMAAVGG